ncbi:MAG: VCBS repeat-containing protein [Reichenbachiella sp.]|uniref:VCBS repeat-containing protein n=2 Tax=Reichenbachiella sp. TaxID=2184521 RepID=UPI003263FA06
MNKAVPMFIRSNSAVFVSTLVKLQYFFLILFIFSFVSCDSTKKRFELMNPEATGIHFSNDIIETDTLNIYNFMNVYHGGGVACGDINNDGLTDLFFTGNDVSNRLYINKGNLSFEDITKSAGLISSDWCTGATIVDVNQDGWLDVYVSVSWPQNSSFGKSNLLYINNGDLTFTESAEAYGLANKDQVMQVSFFDYDLDQDLDVVMILNPIDNTLTDVNYIQKKRINGEAASTDKLYRNNGNGTFTDVSKEAGILIEGYSLSVNTSDINQDGWPDIYIANDFLTNDILYINQKDGTFSDQTSKYIKHTSFAGMGSDVADINNDGLPDIFVLDMLPEDNKRRKTIIPASSYDKFQIAVKTGYDPQYTRNTLQLNAGNGKFNEVGQLLGIDATDWSWSGLFADYDNDGDKDLLITNGFYRDLGDLDYVHYKQRQNASPFGSREAVLDEKKKVMLALAQVKVPNYLYENKGNLSFENKSREWGGDVPSCSNGAIYADLDNDGDLDMVINNIGDKAHIYKNNSNLFDGGNYLKIDLRGPKGNMAGIGVKIWLWVDGKPQYYEHQLTRGYQSSMNNEIHFGIGNANAVDSVIVQWPYQSKETIRSIQANKTLSVTYRDDNEEIARKTDIQTLFKRVDQSRGINFAHKENLFVDFKVQSLLPHKISEFGPGIAVGDIDEDGDDDFYVGGAANALGHLFRQNEDGSFSNNVIHQDSLYEDMGSLLFDADDDGDLDLYVVSGGSSHLGNADEYQDRLYLNVGDGRFFHDKNALPKINSSGSCVVAADYDYDGDLDLFVGGRVVPGSYPMAAKSYLLENNRGKFEDVTEKICPALSEVGMVTSALWTDFNTDGFIDLIVVGEWMPIRFFRSSGRELVEVNTGIKESSGWWNSINGADFDQDGDVDYIVGNLGLNSRLKASAIEPVEIYASDFDKNGRIDPVMTYYIQGQKQVMHPRDLMITQMSAMRSRFKTYQSYADASFEQTLSPQEITEAYVLKSEWFESSYLENLGNGEFSIQALPIEAQFAPVFGTCIDDYDQDGFMDVLLVGNFYGAEVSVGQYDAQSGLLLKGNGKGAFQSVNSAQSGFVADGNTRGIAKIMDTQHRPICLVLNNDAESISYTTETPIQELIDLRSQDRFVLIHNSNGKISREEIYYGSSYLTQSTRKMVWAKNAIKVEVVDYLGNSRVIKKDNK